MPRAYEPSSSGSSTSRDTYPPYVPNGKDNPERVAEQRQKGENAEEKRRQKKEKEEEGVTRDPKQEWDKPPESKKAQSEAYHR